MSLVRWLGLGLAAGAGVGGLVVADVARQVSQVPVPYPSLLASASIAHEDTYADCYEVPVFAPLVAGAERLSDSTATRLLARCFFGGPLFSMERRILGMGLAAGSGGDPKQGRERGGAGEPRRVPWERPAGGAALDPCPLSLEYHVGDRLAFGKFTVTERTPNQVLLSWQGSHRLGIAGATWLSVSRAGPCEFRLRAGSGIWGDQAVYRPNPGSLTLRLHRLYSKLLLYSAARRFELMLPTEAAAGGGAG